jgi:hypothetical protein
VSERAIAWVLEESGLKQPELGILTALAYHADRDGRVNLSTPLTARHGGVSERTVFRSLPRLREQGFITEESQGVRGTWVYRLLMGRTPDTETPMTQSHDTESGVTESHGSTPVVSKERRSVEKTTDRALEGSSLSLLREDPVVLAVVRRFQEAAQDNRSLTVDEPKIARVLAEYAGMPQLEQEGIHCAEWLGAQNGRKRRVAHLTLRNWLKRIQEKEAPSGRRTDYDSAVRN